MSSTFIKALKELEVSLEYSFWYLNFNLVFKSWQADFAPLFWWAVGPMYCRKKLQNELDMFIMGPTLLDILEHTQK
jgi:hypothetical protein